MNKKYRLVGYSYNPETGETNLCVSKSIKPVNMNGLLSYYLFKIKEQIKFKIYGKSWYEYRSHIIRNKDNMSLGRYIDINGEYKLISYVQIYEVSYENDSIRYRDYTIKRSDDGRSFNAISDNSKIGITSLITKESQVFKFIDHLYEIEEK